jgi:acetylornithine deacetylase
MKTEQILDRALSILSDLVGFDTTSRNSNLDLIAYVEETVRPFAAHSRRFANEDGTKANLLVKIGTSDAPGIVLSGHTDVVPIDGQDWSTEPFALTRIGDRLFGRGTCDMKGFVAAALAAVPLFSKTPLERPIYIALSYDEEIGCCGSPALVRAVGAMRPPPAAVIVGEPTMMAMVGAHKGLTRYTVSVTGREAHSSLPHAGISAITASIRLLACLDGIANDLAANSAMTGFDPSHSTINVGMIAGGTASNILARHCRFDVEVRTVPGDDVDAVLAPFRHEIAVVDAMLRATTPELGVAITECANTPPLLLETDGTAQSLVRDIIGGDAVPGAVAYVAEAGQFQQAGLSTIVCGPGSIAQAHKPDEFIELDQLRRCTDFMLALARRLSV